MKYPFTVFFNKEPDNMGGGSNNNADNDKSNNEQEGAGDDQSGDVDSDSSARSLYNQYHGLTEKGERKRGILAEALSQIEEEESRGDGGTSEEGDNQDKKTSQDGGVKEKEDQSKKKEEELSLDEALNSDAKNKDGSPIDKRPGVLIKNLKRHLTDATTRLKEYDSEEYKQKISKYESLEAQLTEALEKNKQLQERFDEEFFESSDAFKEAIEKPVADAFEEVSAFFEHYNPNDKDDKAAINEAATLVKNAAQAAAKGKKQEFLSIVEELSGFIKGNPGGAIHNAFFRAMERYGEATKEQAKAYQEKGDKRKQLVESRVSESRSKSIGSAESQISSFLKKHEADNKVFIEHLPPELKEKYIASYRNTEKEAKGALSKFAVSGSLSPELNNLISKGVAFDSVVQEKTLAWGAFKDANNRIKILEEQLEAEKKKNAKYSGGREKEGRVSHPSPSKTTTGKRSALAESLAEVGVELG